MILHILYVGLVVVLLFGATVFVHELGHFLAARWFGMVVEVFSIGFGPAIWQRKLRGVCYKIGIVPVGGYVSLPQMDPEAAGEQLSESKSDESAPRVLPPVSPWHKIVVALAGGAGNLLLAVLLAWIVYLVGKPSMPAERSALIGFVTTNTPAWDAGLRPGDEILAVNGRTVANWHEVLQENALVDETLLEVRDPAGIREVALATERTMLGFRMVPGLREVGLCRVMSVEPDSSAAAAGLLPGDLIVEFDGVRVLSIEQLILLVSARPEQQAPIVVERDGRPLEVPVVPRFDPETGRARIGVRFDPMAVDYDQMVHIPPSVQLRSHATGILRVLRALLTPREARATSEGLAGPIMILYLFQDMVRKGLVVALWFTCFLNVNLAILNLVPLPVLDGGHVLFALLERIRGKPLSRRFVGWISQLCFGLLIAVFLLLSLRDVRRIYRMVHIFRAAPAEQAAPEEDSGENP
ncbi:MAG: RIP metalloprotease RseP [Kiritimatiellia bacterium]